MTEKSEWQFLVDYVKDDTTDFRNAVCRSQLMALWTAYCMHNDLCVDTKMYDATLFDSSVISIAQSLSETSSASLLATRYAFTLASRGWSRKTSKT